MRVVAAVALALALVLLLLLGFLRVARELLSRTIYELPSMDTDVSSEQRRRARRTAAS
jgi:hypothetical protein